MTATTPSTNAPRTSAWLSRIMPLLSVVLLIVGAAAVHQFLSDITYDAIVNTLGQLPAWRIAAAIACTAVSFLALTGYDALALNYLGYRLAYRTIAMAAFCGYAISNTIGFGAVTGGSVRLRMYFAHDVEPTDIARLSLITVIALILGTVSVGALAMIAEPDLLTKSTGWTASGIRYLGSLLLCVLIVLVALRGLCRQPLRLGFMTLTLPSVRTILLQLLIASVDVASAGTCLYVLIDLPSVSLSAVLTVYAAALLLALVSQLPGGIGVFESVMLLGLQGSVPTTHLTAALVGYRLVYYLLPLVIAVGVLVLTVIREHSQQALRAVRRAHGLSVKLIPTALGALTFFNGCILLISTATPAIPARLQILEAMVPIMLVELSTLTASVVGLALLLISRGLFRKLDGACWMAMIMCLAGSVASLIKGIDYEEGIILLLTAFALYLSRRAFYRRTALMAAPFTWPWVLALAAIMSGMLWIVLFAYKHVDYAHSLWWQFEYNAEASRSLRATLGVTIALVMFGLYRLLQSPNIVFTAPRLQDLDAAESILCDQDIVAANLALMGDKYLIFSTRQDAFLMFAIQDRSWIALGDPVGDARAGDDLAWQFREWADRQNARIAFYQTRPERLPLYLDMGLVPLKLGEEAVVELERFTLQGSRNKSLRQSYTHAQRHGFQFEIVQRPDVTDDLLSKLAAISDGWLATKTAREKGFSLGHFDPAYLQRFDLALVRWHGDIVAFANMLTTTTRLESTIDLMRYLPELPAGVMIFMFVELLHFFQTAGYQRFMLGMAPLAGLPQHALAPVWYRVGQQIFLHGEHFYNFQGLHDFKQKFNPIWEPRYLLTEGGISPYLVLADIAQLVGQGFKGIFRK